MKRSVLRKRSKSVSCRQIHSSSVKACCISWRSVLKSSAFRVSSSASWDHYRIPFDASGSSIGETMAECGQDIMRKPSHGAYKDSLDMARSAPSLLATMQQRGIPNKHGPIVGDARSSGRTSLPGHRGSEGSAIDRSSWPSQAGRLPPATSSFPAPVLRSSRRSSAICWEAG